MNNVTLRKRKAASLFTYPASVPGTSALSTRQHEKLIWAEEEFAQGHFDGLDSHEIVRRLRDAGLDQKTVKAFGSWFVRNGLNQGWLLTEMGFD